MAHLVGHEVDGEAVAEGCGERGAAARLHVLADDTEVGDTAEALAHAEVTDVVVVGADDLTDDGLVGVEHVAAVGGVGEAGGRAARAVGAREQRLGVEVELVVVVDQHQVERDVGVVDLVDPVDQRHLRAGDDLVDLGHVGVVDRHLGADELVGVRRVGGHREAVLAGDDRCAGLLAGAPGGGPLLGACAGLGRGVLRLEGARQGGLVEGPRRVERAQAVGDVERVARQVGVLVGRLDVPGVDAVDDAGVEARDGRVEADRRGRAVDARAGVGPDLGVLGGEAVLHGADRRDPEALGAALGQRQREHGRVGRAARRHPAREARLVEAQAEELARVDAAGQPLEGRRQVHVAEHPEERTRGGGRRGRTERRRPRRSPRSLEVAADAAWAGALTAATATSAGAVRASERASCRGRERRRTGSSRESGRGAWSGDADAQKAPASSRFGARSRAVRARRQDNVRERLWSRPQRHFAPMLLRAWVCGVGPAVVGVHVVGGLEVGRVRREPHGVEERLAPREQLLARRREVGSRVDPAGLLGRHADDARPVRRQRDPGDVPRASECSVLHRLPNDPSRLARS